MPRGLPCSGARTPEQALASAGPQACLSALSWWESPSVTLSALGASASGASMRDSVLALGTLCQQGQAARCQGALELPGGRGVVSVDEEGLWAQLQACERLPVPRVKGVPPLIWSCISSRPRTAEPSNPALGAGQEQCSVMLDPQGLRVAVGTDRLRSGGSCQGPPSELPVSSQPQCQD